MNRGQPTKFNPARCEAIVEALRKGASMEAAAGVNGIAYQTLNEWIKAGRDAGSGDYYDFSENVARARAEAEVRNTYSLQLAGQPHDVQTVTETDDFLPGKRKIRLSVDTEIGGVVYPRGTTIEEPVAVPIHRRTVVSGKEWDWRANLEWLKRRHPREWQEIKTLNVRELSTDDLLRILEIDDDPGEDPESDAGGSPETEEAGDPGTGPTGGTPEG